MPRRVSAPPLMVGERERGPLEQEALAHAADRIRRERAGGSPPDTWEERWWTREAPDLLADLRPPIDPTAVPPAIEQAARAMEEAAKRLAPERRRRMREAYPRDEDERRWSRKVNKRVRAGMAPSEAFEEAHRRLAEWKERTGR